MPTVISDPPDWLYISLFVALLAALGIWYRYRGRKSLIALGFAAALFFGLLFIDLAVDSPRESIIRAAAGIQDDFNTGEWAKLEKHISDDFDRKGRKKNDVKAAYDLAKQYNAKVSFWAFNRNDVVVSGEAVTVGFDVKPQGPEAEGFHRYVRAKFVKSPNGTWKLVTYTSYKSLNHETEEEFGAGW